MTSERIEQLTEYQSDSQQRLASELSLRRTRPPAEIRGYDFESFLGSGAYGEVWVALDRNTGRKVAVKFYTHKGGLDWQLLSREVEKLVLLSADRYIVQVLDVGWDATPPHYVMEFIENGSLDEYLKRRGTLSVEDAVDMFRGVATGLLHAHNKGVLHCDIKPANVLLDQDHRPRLADFGQSRLSDEQSPALGTLFYMAPEQADMNAMPDARWDVYALGVLLYLMLVGELPHRNAANIASINDASGLEERLKAYRNAIRNSSAPTEHRSARGVDRALADIVDRCIAVSPKDRYPNIQSVIDALDVRERNRARRPLLLLGILGPAILLAVMAFFGWRGYTQAMGNSDTAVMKKAQEGNEFAAQFVSSGVAHELERYFLAVERVAENEQFVELFEDTVKHEKLAPMLDELQDLDPVSLDDPSLSPQRRARLLSLMALRDEFEDLGKVEKKEAERDRDATEYDAQTLAKKPRLALQSRMHGLLDDERKPLAASWITTDRHGTHVASAFPSPPSRSPIGRNFAYRSYFNGSSLDKPVGWHPEQGEHLKETHLSGVFQSTATNAWKVAISAPIVNKNGEFLGIVGLTVEMGGFLGEFEDTETRYAVLVDGREGPYQGVILQHPLFDELLEEQRLQNEQRRQQDEEEEDVKLPDRFSTYRVPLNGKESADVVRESRYFDPLGKDELGSDYSQPWIMAKAPVRLRRGPKDDSGAPTMRRTGWYVLVQEDYNAAIEPVQNLGRRLFREGLTALGAVFVTIAALWFFVVRGVGRAAAPVLRRNGGASELTPGPEKSTIPNR